RDLAGEIELPRLLWPGDVAGSVSALAALETLLPVGTPVIAGTIDAWAEAVSVDAHNPNDLMLMYGSTMFLIHTVETLLRGLTLAHSRGDVYRAALESIALGVRHNIEAMEEAGADIERVVAVGGGTQGSLWTQIVSDVTRRNQEIPTHTMGASYGCAYLAAS